MVENNSSKPMSNSVILIEQAGGKIIIGENSNINGFSHLRAYKENIEIGRDVQISYYVHMITAYGATYEPEIKETKIRPIKICDGAFIGYGAQIRGGVTVGEYAIVGMGAIVLSDVPPFSIAVGNPARIVGTRKDKNLIEIRKDGGKDE